MISAKELYQKILEKYPDFQVPNHNPCEEFYYPPRPPLTMEELELLEMGYPVKPSFDPFRDNESREYTHKLVGQMLNQRDKKKRFATSDSANNDAQILKSLEPI